MRNTIIEKSRRRLLVLSISILLLTVAGGGLFALNQWQSVMQYQQMVSKADRAMTDGQYESAVQILVRCLAFYPDDPKLLAAYVQAQNHVQNQAHRNMELTIDVLNRSLLTHPSMNDAARQLTDLYMASGDAMQAIEVTDRLLTEQPDNVQMLKRRALAHARLGHQQLAMDDVEHCIKLLPQDLDLYLLQLYLMKLSDQPGDQMLATVESWQHVLTNLAWYQALMGVACRLIQLDQQALHWFNEAASTPNEDARLTSLLIQQFDAMGQFTQASTLLDHAELTGSPELLYQKAWRLWQSQNDATLLSLDHQNVPQVLAMQILAAQRGEQPQQAMTLFSTLSKISNDQVAQAWHEMIHKIMPGSDASTLQIINAAQHVRMISARHELADVVLARQWETLGQQANALDTWRCVSKASSYWALPYLQQARLLLNMGHPLAAAATARQAMQCDPSDIHAGVLLAESLAQSDKPNARGMATAVYQQITDQLQDDTRLLLAAKVLNVNEVSEQIRAFSAKPQNLTADTWLTLAQVGLDRDTDWPEACLKTYRNQWGTSARWLELKAQSMHKTGRTVAARQLVATMANEQSLRKPTDAVQWQLVQAAFLTTIGDHLAAHIAWQHVLEQNPENLQVACTLLQQPADAIQRSLRQRAISQMRRLTGELAVAWRYEQAKLLLEQNVNNQALSEASRLLHAALNIAPSAIQCRLLLMTCLETIGSEQGMQEQALAILQVDPYNTTALSQLRQAVNR